MKKQFPIEAFGNLQTPFYYYDMDILTETLNSIVEEANKYNYYVHYAVKANANPRILSAISRAKFGADCVSGGEILAALEAGFPEEKIVFAGVGKADWEIELGLDKNISCFNVESIPELKIIDQIAAAKGKIAKVAIRINPEVDAHTHSHITTGTREDKFGINFEQIDQVINTLDSISSVKLTGIHFHIGSQITEMESFATLSIKAVEIERYLTQRRVFLENINFGGGLGIDYKSPDENPLPDFKAWFEIFRKNFPTRPGRKIHFEPGRSLVGQCGSLISKVLYVKEGSFKSFAILDAGFTDLIRPTLYGAGHKIENLSSDEVQDIYDVVGPVCESSDCFARAVKLNKVHRGDYLALRSAGAYGESMAMQYNCRSLPKSYFSDTIQNLKI
ncbi:MAG: diaminopimelate decarboxylase [Dysgonamonadaceae bacterium]|jgi:diaminopimelate decarboxylase|nr:diaminopimelate decarboxylase [Dysgonamonadaceae bacterium]